LRDIRDDLRQIGYGHVEIPAVEVLSYSSFLGKYGTPAFAKKQTEEHMAYLAAKSALQEAAAKPAAYPRGIELYASLGGQADTDVGVSLDDVYEESDGQASAQVYEGFIGQADVVALGAYEGFIGQGAANASNDFAGFDSKGDSEGDFDC